MRHKEWRGIGIAAVAMLTCPAAAASGRSSSIEARGARTVADAIARLNETPATRPKTYKRSMAAIPVGDMGAWFDPDSYPPEAIGANRQGRVVIEVGIDSAGAVVSCTIKISSGTTILDDRTCALAKERGRYNPATDARGRPIASTTIIPVRWQIPEQPTAVVDYASAPHRRSLTIEAYYSAAGILTSCKVVDVQPPGDASAAAACPDKLIGSQAMVVTRDAKPVAYKVIRQSSLEIVPSP